MSAIDKVITQEDTKVWRLATTLHLENHYYDFDDFKLPIAPVSVLDDTGKRIGSASFDMDLCPSDSRFGREAHLLYVSLVVDYHLPERLDFEHGESVIVELLGVIESDFPMDLHNLHFYSRPKITGLTCPQVVLRTLGDKAPEHDWWDYAESMH